MCLTTSRTSHGTTTSSTAAAPSWKSPASSQKYPLPQFTFQRMRSIDSDIKVLNDTMNETKNNLAQLVKKEGTTLMTKDVAEVIYSDQNIRPRDVFIEMEGSAIFSTLIVILHK